MDYCKWPIQAAPSSPMLKRRLMSLQLKSTDQSVYCKPTCATVSHSSTANVSSGNPERECGRLQARWRSYNKSVKNKNQAWFSWALASIGLSLVTISVCDSHAQDLMARRRGGEDGEEEPQSSTEELSCVFSRLAVSHCPNWGILYPDLVRQRGW